MRLMTGPGICFSPRHRMKFNSRIEGTKCVSMTLRGVGLADSARHVIGCQRTQVMGLPHVFAQHGE